MPIDKEKTTQEGEIGFPLGKTSGRKHMDAVIRDRNSSSCFHPVSSASHKINDPIVKEFLCQPIHISPCIADLEVGSRSQTLLKDRQKGKGECRQRIFTGGNSRHGSAFASQGSNDWLTEFTAYIRKDLRTHACANQSFQLQSHTLTSHTNITHTKAKLNNTALSIDRAMTYSLDR